MTDIKGNQDKASVYGWVCQPASIDGNSSAITGAKRGANLFMEVGTNPFFARYNVRVIYSVVARNSTTASLELAFTVSGLFKEVNLRPADVFVLAGIPVNRTIARTNVYTDPVNSSQPGTVYLVDTKPSQVDAIANPYGDTDVVALRVSTITTRLEARLFVVLPTA